MLRKTKLITGMIVLVVLLVWGLISSAAPAEGVTVGKTLPQFTLQSLGGQSIIVGPASNVTVLNFWTTWCPPCRGEMPELNEFALQYNGKVAFYGINVSEEFGVVNNFMYKNGYSIPVLLDSDGAVGNLFRVQYLPTTIVVDASGVIRYRKSGPVTKSELENIISQL